ncbi:CHAT domain-containing protein [Neolewinella agarilytica]|uniref:CHAT domain-containing protein n=1 Tax=Neolewinella agarilytica TaxID=478744 RepID=UPI002353A9E9|nr:CHAT domain-containing protein [Neolewinella agarilytica]
MPTILSQLEDLTAENHLRTVIDFLREQPEINANRRAKQQISLFSGRLRGIEDDEMNQTKEQRLIDIDYNQARGDLLKILNRHRRIIDTITAEVPAPPAPRHPAPGNSQRAPGNSQPATPNLQPATILFLASDPRGVGDLMVDKEISKISIVISDSDLRLKPEMDLRRDTLTQTILDAKPRFVHFSVHGVDDQDGWNPEGIILQNRERNPEVASTEDLKNIFSTLQEVLDLQLVFLNACLSENQARVISAYVPYVVGMSDEIENGVAISFAQGFYLGLSRYPDNIPFAFKMGLRQLKEDGHLEQELPRLFHLGVEKTVVVLEEGGDLEVQIDLAN